MEPPSDSERDYVRGLFEKFLMPLALGVAIPIFSGAAYLTGVAYHQAYLNAFRIPQNLIAKSTADYFLYAYMAVAESGMKFFTLSGLASIIVISIFAVYFFQIFRWIDRKINQSSHIEWLRSRAQSNPVFRTAGKLVIVPTLVIAFGYLALASFIAFIMPMMFGEIAGARRAAEDIAVFQQGCHKPRKDSRYCNELFENGGAAPVASGFVIDSSEKYIAIYESGTIRTYPVEGKRFVAALNISPPPLKSAE